VQLPVDRLAVAVDRELTADSVLGADRTLLHGYTAAHIAAAGADGRPSLIVLARTPVYPAFRVGVAAVGLLFSVSWMLERAALTSSDPFEGVQTWLVEHPLVVAGSVAALAVVARRATPPAPAPTSTPTSAASAHGLTWHDLG
jgi:hypothetical protein